MMLSIFKNKKIILASQSPRRKDLLKKAGLSFEVKVADIDEAINESKDLFKELMDVANRKAAKVAENNDGIIIGADTIVVYEKHILTKPLDKEDALKTIKILSGKTHQVMTAYSLINTETGKQLNNCISTDVTFFNLSDEDVAWYVETGEVYDKAGSYAIQEYGMLLVKNIEGSYTNIVGLPVEYLIRDLRKIV